MVQKNRKRVEGEVYLQLDLYRKKTMQKSGKYFITSVPVQPCSILLNCFKKQGIKEGISKQLPRQFWLNSLNASAN